MLTKDQLLQKRYKVIADYPFSDCEVGDIFLEGCYEKVFFDNLKKYPHLFHEMPWWEDRKESEMPEYVKEVSTGIIIKVKEHRHWFDDFMFACGNEEVFFNTVSYHNSQPTDLNDYLNYQKKEK